MNTYWYIGLVVLIALAFYMILVLEKITLRNFDSVGKAIKENNLELAKKMSDSVQLIKAAAQQAIENCNVQENLIWKILPNGCLIADRQLVLNSIGEDVHQIVKKMYFDKTVDQFLIDYSSSNVNPIFIWFNWIGYKPLNDCYDLLYSLSLGDNDAAIRRRAYLISALLYGRPVTPVLLERMDQRVIVETALYTYLTRVIAIDDILSHVGDETGCITQDIDPVDLVGMMSYDSRITKAVLSSLKRPHANFVVLATNLKRWGDDFVNTITRNGKYEYYTMLRLRLTWCLINQGLGVPKDYLGVNNKTLKFLKERIE